MAESNYIQQSFVGGLNQQIDSTRLDRDEYPLLINGRNRYDVIMPVMLPNQINDVALTGVNYQGLYAASNVSFIFIDGLTYWKDWDFPASNWQPLDAPAMDSQVKTIFAELVPASYQNFQRVLNKTNDNVKTDTLLTSAIDQTPQALVVQDGISQANIVLSTTQARRSQNYSQWKAGSREYVPIGKQMLFHNGILYIITKDGRRILRSVTGRPLDFMVNLQPGPDGEAWPEENAGGAETVSHAVGYDEITSINRLAIDDGSFFISTRFSSHAVTPIITPEKLIFGEPIFANRYLFSAGCISPFAFIELLGDTAFQDFNGLRSFNAINQLKVEGKNAPFSKKVGPILQGILQDYVAATTFDNYALFACNTIYGRGIIVYDTLSENFVGLDLYPGVNQIKQFAEIKNSSGQRFLLFITTDNKLYQAFPETGTIANTALYVGEWCSNDPKFEQHISQLKLVFIDCKNSGSVTIKSFVDRRLNKTMSQVLEAKSSNMNNTLPIAVPYGETNDDTVQILSFDVGRSKLGWKVGFLISWNVNATLSHIGLTSSLEQSINSVETSAKMYKRSLAALNNS